MVAEGYPIIAVGSCIIGAAIGVFYMAAFQPYMERLSLLYLAHFIASFLFSIPLGSQLLELKKNLSIFTMIEDQLIGLSIIAGVFLIQYCISCPEISSDCYSRDVSFDASRDVSRYSSTFFYQSQKNPLQTDNDEVDNNAVDNNALGSAMV
jgi:hypothetical protein